MHTHASLCAVLQNIVMARAALPGDVLLNVRPLWPIAVALLAHVLSGGQLVLAERFEASTFVGQLQQHRAAFSSLVPTQLLRVLREPRLAYPDLSVLKSIDIGAAAIAPSVLDDACELFGPRLSVLYGMTEAPGPAICRPHKWVNCAATVRAPKGWSGARCLLRGYESTGPMTRAWVKSCWRVRS
jgi:long-subunit acyl-CoA synthetase (AMP-forming)